MKFTPTRNSVISTSAISQFTMAVNEKSFSILTSGIYKNKIKAVIREYSTNALDSHIEAGNLNPFEVHLPTEKECYFYVRDYGTGLDEEQFKNVFFRFFESTKDKSNEYNGTMGLGSKVFFSYNTKSFTVESWKNGFHYIYSCVIDQSGLPSYSQLLKEYSQDPEGIKVQASVDPKDIEEFEENAIDVYNFFERKPKFIGHQIELNDIYKDKKEHYSIRKVSYYGDRGSYAVMGNVAYPIENNYNLNKHSNLINSNLLLFFDIGELTFTPSRESLEYTDYTIKNLKSKFENVLEEINNDIVGQINNVKTEFAAVKQFNSLYSIYSSNVKGLVKPDKLVWKGKTLNTEPIDIPVILFSFNRKSGYFENKMPIKDYEYVINDLKTGSITRSVELRDSKTKCVYLIQEKDLSKIELTYNDSDFIKASSLPKPIRNVKKRSSLSSFSEMLNERFLTDAWKPIDIKDAKSKYYVVRKGYRPIYNGNISKPQNVYVYARKAGFTDPIYGVSQRQEKAIIDLGFINIYNAIADSKKTIIEELDKQKDLIIELFTYNSFLKSNDQFIKHLKNVHKKYCLTNKDLISIIDLSNNFDSKTHNKIVDKIHSLYTIGEQYEVKLNNNLIKNHNDVIAKYPMLTKNMGYYYNFSVEDIYYYISGVDYINSQ